MPSSFYIFLVASFIALIPTYFDHGETWEEIKTGSGNKKCHNLIKLSALWIIPILTIIGTIYLGIESVISDRQDKQHEADLTSAHKEILGLSNQVQQVSTEYNEATNTLAHIRSQMPKKWNVTNDGMIRIIEKLDFIKPIRVDIRNESGANDSYHLAGLLVTAFKDVNVINVTGENEIGEITFGVKMTAKYLPDKNLSDALNQIFTEIGQSPNIVTDPNLDVDLRIEVGGIE